MHQEVGAGCLGSLDGLLELLLSELSTHTDRHPRNTPLTPHACAECLAISTRGYTQHRRDIYVYYCIAGEQRHHVNTELETPTLPNFRPLSCFFFVAPLPFTV